MTHAIKLEDSEVKQPELTPIKRKYQTEMIMKLFEHWNLTVRNQAILLGLSPDTGTSIHNYRNGKNLSAKRDIQDRVKYLLTIHKYLRRAYPYNNELAYSWINTPNKDFNEKAPLELIIQDGLLGLAKIKNYLEFHLLS